MSELLALCRNRTQTSLFFDGVQIKVWSSGMPSDLRGADLFSTMVTDAASARASHYKQEAGKFRQTAEAETNDRLRLSLLELSKQYGDLAAKALRDSKRLGLGVQADGQDRLVL